MPEFMTFNKVASYSWVSEKTVYRLINEDFFPAMRIGHLCGFKLPTVRWRLSVTPSPMIRKNPCAVSCLSNVLLQDYVDKFDEQGKDYLQDVELRV